MGMWLENYYHTLAWQAFGRGTAPSIRNTSGNSVNQSGRGTVENIAPGCNANQNSIACITFGTGDTAVTYQDYKLDSKWVNDITRVSTTSTTPTVDTTTGVVSSTMTATVQNTGAADVTIREWGIELGVGYIYGTTPHYDPVLVYRDLLASPVTLHQYEAATFTCTLLYQIPNWTAPEQA